MKKLVALLLALVMCLSLACFTVQAEEEQVIHPLRIVQPGTRCDDYDTGIAAVNEKLLADGVNLQIEHIMIPWGDYDTKLNLMLSTGEEFELLHIMQDVKNMSSLIALGAIVPIDEYLDNYPDLVALFTDTEWLGALYNGEHYAVPCSWRTFDNAMSYVTARTDVMQAVGYETMPETTDELVEMYQKMQDYILEETGLYATTWFHQVQDTAHYLHRTYDSYPFYVENSLGIILCRQDGTIDSFYESEEFKNDASFYYQLYQAGLIDPDILSRDHQYQYDMSKLGAFLPSPTFDVTEEINIKKNTDITTAVTDSYTLCPEKPEMIYTFVQNLNGISATAEDPESGLKFLNWLYASTENHDLYHYGIEGVHYNKVGDKKMEWITDENGNTPYSQATWMTGYLPYMRYTTEQPQKYIDYCEYKADNYAISPIAGFIFDATNVQAELTNLQTEIIASIYPIKLGMVSYEDNIDTAIANLKAAGLDTYLEEYRKQFAAYLEANPWVLETANEHIK